MTGIFDWIFTFIGRAFAVPELHAILAAMFAGMALAYLLTLPLPAMTPVKTAVRYGRVLIFFVVMGVALTFEPTPRTAAWAFSIAILTPLFHEWLFAIVYHRWPWLKPKALMTAPELVKAAEKIIEDEKASENDAGAPPT